MTMAQAKKARKKTTARKPARKAPARKPAKRKAATKKAPARKAARRKPAKKAAPKRKRTPNAAFMKAMTPSGDLAAVVGDRAMPRTEVTKKIWDYIKRNKLQDSANRRMINADDKLRPIFGGKRQVSMFEMTKLVNAHLK
jgi:chromatin remodeling complex protein RSC6